MNLFYAYRSKEFYPEIEEHMVTAESVVLLLINKVDTVWSEEAGMDVYEHSFSLRKFGYGC